MKLVSIHSPKFSHGSGNSIRQGHNALRNALFLLCLYKVKKFTLLLFLIPLMVSCKESINTSEASTLPDGYELVSSDSNSYFVYVKEEYQNNKMEQREVGKEICESTYDKTQYCEVYFFAKRSDIPRKFPIVNRAQPIGVFNMKYGQNSLRALTSYKDKPETRVVFLKELQKRKTARSKFLNNGHDTY